LPNSWFKKTYYSKADGAAVSAERVTRTQVEMLVERKYGHHGQFSIGGIKFSIVPGDPIVVVNVAGKFSVNRFHKQFTGSCHLKLSPNMNAWEIDLLTFDSRDMDSAIRSAQSHDLRPTQIATFRRFHPAM
jgi:hypothetical protein